MKTTNFEISKELKEIGFEAETDKCWAKIRNSKLDEFSIRTLDFSIPANCDEWYLSYDLETLINALPKTIKFKHKEYCFWMQWSGSSDCLLIGYVYGNLRAVELEVWQEENESLADVAGKLLIELYEAGIINFKK